MTRLGWLIVGGLLLAGGIVAGAVAYIHMHSAKDVPAATVATTTPLATVNPSELAIYTSGQYGFTFFYPASAMVFDDYSATSTQGLPWRTNATATGTPIVRLTFASGELRIGQSTNAREVTVCTKQGPAETSLDSLKVGSTTWSVFSFDSVGTDDQEHITSYRSVHAGSCYSLETFEPLGTGATETATASSTGFGLANIVQSFSFAH